jgi:Polyketide cyclase / dehydrase and lipid transport/GyrI-like small molecule binding domain
MWWILIVLVMAGLVAYLLSLPSTSHVVRSIVINKPVSEVYRFVRDFANWNSWSPWMIHEPSCKTETVNGAALGGTHAWDGSKIGAGSMQHTAQVDNERIEMLLTFLRPFKSTANVTFAFQDIGTADAAATQVTWTMNSKAPIFLRPFLPFMQLMVGHDFSLGLAFLRGRLDPASEHPRVAFDGEVTLAAQQYVTEPFEGTLVDMRKAMKLGYPKLWGMIQQDTSRMVQAPMLAAYHKVKPLKGWVRMDMALPVSKMLAGETSLQTQAGRYFQVTMHGNYDFVGHVWNAAYGQAKMQKLKIDKSRPALEIYTVNPMQGPNSNDWETKLCIPLK